MASYATVENVAAGFRTLSDDEKTAATALLSDAGIIIDAYNKNASTDAKTLVSCRMVRRVLGDGSDVSGFPIGSTQGSISALGYSQSWQTTTGATGELYLSKLDKKLLGVGNSVGASNPLGVLVND